MSNKILEISNPIREILKENNYDLYDVDLEQENQNWYLRVYIRRIDGENIDIEDCIKGTACLNSYLDANDPIDSEYMLEVSSPGIIRKLRTTTHFNEVIGEVISISLSKKVEGFETKKFTGKLNSVDDNNIIIDDVEISRAKIRRAETTFEF